MLKLTRKKKSIIGNLIDDGSGNADAAEEMVEFTQQDLALQWLSMCNRMPQKLGAIATRMKNMTPVITDHPAIEVVVDNQLALEQMEQHCQHAETRPSPSRHHSHHACGRASGTRASALPSGAVRTNGTRKSLSR